MNEITNNFLFAGDKFMLEILDGFSNQKQPKVRHAACGPFTKNKEISWKRIDNMIDNSMYFLDMYIVYKYFDKN